jgi:diguanylate cyclase (GGDEF)-like protein
MYRVMADQLSPRAGWMVPFGLASALPFGMLLLPGPSFGVLPTLIAVGMAAISLTFAWVVAWHRAPDWWTLVPALGYMSVVALLRDAGGGTASGVGPMVLLPVIWMALVGTRRTLIVSVVAVAVVYWGPLLLDPGDYPDSGWRIGAGFVCLCGILGATMQALRDQVRAQADRLTGLALADDLTSLANRRAWDGALESALIAAERRGEPLCVALIDVDHFKAINDAYGHAHGDTVLVSLARSWDAASRRGDLLARLGGDEFALLLAAADLDEARVVVGRLSEATAHTPCSIGLAQWDGRESGARLAERADALLYEAKALGRNRLQAQPQLRGAVTAETG